MHQSRKSQPHLGFFFLYDLQKYLDCSYSNSLTLYSRNDTRSFEFRKENLNLAP